MGVRIFYYLTDEEELTDTAEHRMLGTLRAFQAEMEREKGRQRTRDALAARAKQGWVTGGAVFGYRNVPVNIGTDELGNPHRSHVVHEIDDVQAGVVVGIFEMYVDGFGLKSIAKALNGDPGLADARQRYFAGRIVPSPRKGTGSWSPACVNAMLKRERYIGKNVWGRFKNTDRGGRTRLRVEQPEDERLMVEQPDLRIVSDDLWQAAQARRDQHRRGADRKPDGTTIPAPRLSRSLLSGLASCGRCGGPMIISGSLRRTRCYGCSYYRNRGATVCDNQLLESIDRVDDRFLAEIERTVLHPEARRFTLKRAAALVRERLAMRPDTLTALQRDLTTTRKQINHLVEAIESGKPPKSLLDRLGDKEREAAAIAAEVKRIEVVSRTGLGDLRQIDRLLEQQLMQLGDTLRGNVIKARQALRTLLVDRIRCTPIELLDGRRTYRLEANLTLGGMITEEACSKVNVPDGI